MEGREGEREGRRVSDTRALHNDQVQAWLCTCMPVVVSIHSAMTCWREGLRAVGGEGSERGQGGSQGRRKEPAAANTL